MKTNFIYGSIVICLALVVTACKDKGEIPVIGYDADGNPAQVLAPKKDYMGRMIMATNTIKDSALPVLERHENKNRFMLRTVGVGVFTNVEVGIGPYKIGAVPKFRVFFTNSNDINFP